MNARPNASDIAHAEQFFASYDADEDWKSRHRDKIIRQAAMFAMIERINRAMPASRAALAPSGLSPQAVSGLRLPPAIARKRA